MVLPLIRAVGRGYLLKKGADLVGSATGLKVVYKDTPSSTAIARIGYSVALQELRIVFRDKEEYPEYVWGGVDPELALQFMHVAGSKGKFYHRNLKGRGEMRITSTMGSFKLGAIGRRISKAIGSTR